MNVLVLNAGSSSLKFSLTDTRAQRHRLRGLVERIGLEQARLTLEGRTEAVAAADHAAALQAVLRRLDLDLVEAVGHRVVHGGDFTASSRITAEVLERLEAFVPLAPLHNPANLAGIRAALTALPHLPQVAVFDTAFHQTLPERAWRYALPRRLADERRYRRYGFHGTSHRYVSGKLARALGRPLEELRLVVLHLGNGASATAVRYGRSVDTSMGFTPMEGLVMGSRSGDLDPGLVLELVRRHGVEATDRLLNKESGMLGLAGHSDLRDVHRRIAEGDAQAAMALQVYTYRIKKYLGAYAAAMGGLDAVAFTAGVGENDPVVRAQALEGLEFLGLELDPEANARGGPRITREGSRVSAWVIPTDEELAIALDTERVLAGQPPSST
ncbi:acetate/propionate family kinase [Oceanithermus desulfurans]|uniref:Acetate kinase n=2 Tax=Oceanithermus desulfurans TaxID=227924 RepID=A0A511RMZ6_9DEIN|nr:acetate kinase [Oceanithermus desulfurans]MBB6029530.1 acetate kinase [Oceanithermus desulfurans]GEM90166.1 acetate kinase [Oceanithermus desulfurans NBRC 100063]